MFFVITSYDRLKKVRKIKDSTVSRVLFLPPVELVCPLSRGNFHSFFTQSWYNISVR